ncbi:MAG: hypothetical protein VYC91_00020 [Acidobacteriota bacterium]|nr:hypothetical protein [Acidobacteriota bacterium]
MVRRIPISRRAQSVSPFLAMEVFERAAELQRSGRSIVHLEFGEPDLETPAVVVEAGIKALRDGHTRYTHSEENIKEGLDRLEFFLHAEERT